MIRVTNNTDSDFTGRYDGIDYQFLRGGYTDLQDPAAVHIFGYGLADKAEAFLRLGWIKNGSDMPDALERLGKLTFQSVQMAAVRSAPIQPAPMPEDEQEKLTPGQRLARA